MKLLEGGGGGLGEGGKGWKGVYVCIFVCLYYVCMHLYIMYVCL